tara:strand:+ start:158 stop:1078 length:921 start_codon:yes stop_codon:yes gene_type:complete
MSSTEVLKYDLTFFDDVKKTSSYVITDDTIKLIQELGNKLTILNKANNFFEKKYSNKKLSTDNWNNVKNFKPTTFVKKEGLDKNINIIRINLNKITNKNYDILSVRILDEIDIIHENNVEHFNTIKNLFIDTVSNVNIYSEIYVMLYRSIIEKYDNSLFNINDDFTILKNDLLNIKIIDSEMNYDDFCKNNKNNERKRNLSLFYINLMKQELFPKEDVINLILDNQTYNFNMINDINNSDIVDEICENLFILIKNAFDYIKDDDKYSLIYNNIVSITKLKKSENNSLTTKSKFKHMDLMDLMDLIK